ncbi:hypothetical protein TMatcc_010685 [Talaromyces marneffei ATCC 18224]
MDNGLAKVLSGQHIHKCCTSLVNSFVNMFLGLDTAFSKPLQYNLTYQVVNYIATPFQTRLRN